MGFGAAFQPCEAGRPPPREDKYVVQFDILWPGVGDSNSTLHPQGFLNLQAYFNEYGQPEAGDTTLFYRFEDDFWSTLSCHLGVDCRGKIWEREDYVIIFLKFPQPPAALSGREDYWRQPVEAAFQLLEIWKLEGTPLNA